MFKFKEKIITLCNGNGYNCGEEGIFVGYVPGVFGSGLVLCGFRNGPAVLKEKEIELASSTINGQSDTK